MQPGQHRVDALMLALYEHAARRPTQQDIDHVCAAERRLELHAQRKTEEQRQWQ